MGRNTVSAEGGALETRRLLSLRLVGPSLRRLIFLVAGASEAILLLWCWSCTCSDLFLAFPSVLGISPNKVRADTLRKFLEAFFLAVSEASLFGGTHVLFIK